MALIRCRECNHEISSKAKTCPNCGAPKKKPTSIVTRLFAYILLIPFVVLFISYLIGDPTSSPVRQPATPSEQTSNPSKPAEVTEQVLNQVRGYISEGRLGTAISTAAKYDLSQSAELKQLHDDAVVTLAAKKQETADGIASDRAAAAAKARESTANAREAAAKAHAEAAEAAIQSSDDFQLHKGGFLKATSTLIDNGTCTLADFREMGGWVRSQSHKPKPVYFTYCGGMTVSNRIYLDVSSGKVFR